MKTNIRNMYQINQANKNNIIDDYYSDLKKVRQLLQNLYIQHKLGIGIRNIYKEQLKTNIHIIFKIIRNEIPKLYFLDKYNKYLIKHIDNIFKHIDNIFNHLDTPLLSYAILFSENKITFTQTIKLQVYINQRIIGQLSIEYDYCSTKFIDDIKMFN